MERKTGSWKFVTFGPVSGIRNDGERVGRWRGCGRINDYIPNAGAGLKLFCLRSNNSTWSLRLQKSLENLTLSTIVRVGPPITQKVVEEIVGNLHPLVRKCARKRGRVKLKSVGALVEMCSSVYDELWF